MDEEVSTGTKIAITVVFLAAFLSTIMLIAMQSEVLLGVVQNESTEVVQATSIQNIVRLQNHNRNYIDLYRTYMEYEPYINSITGVATDGTYRVHYLRNADNVPTDSNTKTAIGSLTGVQKIDGMYNNFLNEYAYESQDTLRVYIYKSKLPQEYEIYYEVLDR